MLGETYTQSYNDWLDKHDAKIREDERKKTLEFVSKRGNTIIVGGRSAESRRKYWVDAMLKEMQKEQKEGIE